MPQSTDEREARRMGRYVVGRRLGTGNTTSIYLAELRGEGGFSHERVLRVQRPELSLDRAEVQRFLEEAALVARLRHPNIVQALDVVYDDTQPFMALELVDGPSLSDLQGYLAGLGQRLPIEHAVHIVVEAARGLHFAHCATDEQGELAGIVHRDVRPGNVLISRLGEVKVADFGFALAASTRTNALGRNGYGPPEQLAGEPVDPRGDVFSLGVILWELVTGRRLFPHPSVRDARAPIQRPSTLVSGLDGPFNQIIERALATKPSRRLATAGGLADELDAWLMRRDSRSGRVPLARWLEQSCPDLGIGGLRPLGVGSETQLKRPRTATPREPEDSLPAFPGETLGRDETLQKIGTAVAYGQRVVVVSGPGGIGKTRLAVEWARRTREAVRSRAVFVDARHASLPVDLAHAIISQLAPPSVRPRGTRDPAMEASELLAASGSTVVVIDQVDHLEPEAIDALLTAWREGTNEAFFVLTSRVAIELGGAMQIELNPLDACSKGGSASELFFTRLEEAGGPEAVQRWRDPSAQPHLETLLERLAGVPLAIEVIASRAGNRAPESMVEELADDAPSAAVAALREAWRGCSSAERSALLQCTVFAGPFIALDAIQVVNIEGDVTSTLAALRDKRLLILDNARFRIHQAVRELAQQLGALEELSAARARHTRFVLDAAGARRREIHGPAAGRAFAALEALEPELRAVHAYAIEERAGEDSMLAVLCLEPTLARRGDHRHLIALLQSVEDLCGDGELSARGAIAESRAHGWLFEFEPALDAATRALALATGAGSVELIAQARSELAMVEVRRGHGIDAAKRYRDALTAMQQIGDRRGQGVVLLRLANLLSEQGDGQAAVMMYRMALEASRDAQDRIYEGMILNNLGAQLLDDGRHEKAHQALFLSQEILEDVGEVRYAAVARGLIGVTLGLEGDWEDCSTIVEESIETLRKIGDRGVLVFFFGVLVSARARLGDEEGARRWAAHMVGLAGALKGTPVDHITTVRRGHLELLDAVRAAEEGRKEEAQRFVLSARQRARDVPRDVLTTLRIASADLHDHSDEVERRLFPHRRRQGSLGRLRLLRRPAPAPEEE